MKSIERFFQIIFEFRNLQEEMFSPSGTDFTIKECNGSNLYTVAALEELLQNTSRNIISESLLESDFPVDRVIFQLEEAKLTFFNAPDADGGVLYQRSCTYTLVENFAQAEAIDLENPEISFLFERYHQFSQVKYDAIEKLEEKLKAVFESGDKSKRLKTKLSVGELSLLFRILHEEKLFEIDSNADLYRFLSENFSTKQANTISDKSIKNKFLSPDNTSINNIDALLVNLRQQLKKIQ